jgi:hypothetical protein
MLILKEELIIPKLFFLFKKKIRINNIYKYITDKFKCFTYLSGCLEYDFINKF